MYNKEALEKFYFLLIIELDSLKKWTDGVGKK
ncbi:hypothetical protein EDD80_12511 [Anseongella ginsenosidimutans]|uniref:Uncharacterized protein n=1 Tax=Anseongella ginsenosidimutans TaxID=496056 RepID=A0A4R3KKE9_9SPHI|nr:hypothetical protein EDD80_12511 [Anseongella ginsenosidimutans]